MTRKKWNKGKAPLHMIPVISPHSYFLWKDFDVFLWEGGPPRHLGFNRDEIALCDERNNVMAHFVNFYRLYDQCNDIRHRKSSCYLSKPWTGFFSFYCSPSTLFYRWRIGHCDCGFTFCVLEVGTNDHSRVGTSFLWWWWLWGPVKHRGETGHSSTSLSTFGSLYQLLH